MKKIILNHKSFLNIKEIEKYKKELNSISKKNIELILFPSVIYLSLFKEYKHNIGAQNFYSYNYGNYTGEINLESLKDIGINYTMLNHSERTKNKLDTKELIKEKVFKSLNSNFNTILIVGEDKCIKEPSKHILKELKYYLKDIENKKLNKLSIMYEPSWLDMDSQDENIIRKVVIDIKEYFIRNYNLNVDVFYGIGVNEENVLNILENCDGIGIGKKSTDIKFVKNIIDKICQNLTK